jgi:putative hemolysin
MNRVSVEAIELQPARLETKLATSSEEVEQALRLRYEVFVNEEKNMKMRTDTGLEQDEYDAYCDHLIVKEAETGRVVGTYRLLPGDRALRHIGFYSETEFDLSRFAPFKARTLELGRSCVARQYRGGKAIQLLWEGIAAYIAERGYDYMIGCASVRMSSLEELNRIYSLLRNQAVITDRFGIAPLPACRIPGLKRLEQEFDEKETFRMLPPLMKGYQWLGAEIGGEPAYDDVFQTVDFLIILQKDRVTRRYRKHFLKS